MTKEQLFKAHLNQIVINAWAQIKTFLMALPVGVVVGVISWFILSALEKKYEILRERKRVAVALIAYLSIILQMGLFSRPFGSIRVMKWIPFITPGGGQLIILYAMANLIIFIPFGFLVTRTFRKSADSVWKIALILLAISLIIEVAQYVLACGTSEVEDVIMNVAGGTIGYWIAKKVEKRKNENRKCMEN